MKEYHDIVGAEIPEDLPLLPLISAAVFPSAVASIQVRIARSLALLDNEVEENEIIATAITKRGSPSRRSSKTSTTSASQFASSPKSEFRTIHIN